MRSEQEITDAVERYADTVRRVCLVYLRDRADVEDVFQDVFLKYMVSFATFESREHEKAWFIRVAINACKDFHKSFFRSRTVPIDEALEVVGVEGVQDHDVLEAVLSLPQKYREAVYLHFFEGYSAPEIGEILEKNVNTVYTLLSRAKGMLRERLSDGSDGKDGFDGR